MVADVLAPNRRQAICDHRINTQYTIQKRAVKSEPRWFLFYAWVCFRWHVCYMYLTFLFLFQTMHPQRASFGYVTMDYQGNIVPRDSPVDLHRTSSDPYLNVTAWLEDTRKTPPLPLPLLLSGEDPGSGSEDSLASDQLYDSMTSMTEVPGADRLVDSQDLAASLRSQTRRALRQQRRRHHHRAPPTKQLPRNLAAFSSCDSLDGPVDILVTADVHRNPSLTHLAANNLHLPSHDLPRRRHRKLSSSSLSDSDHSSFFSLSSSSDPDVRRCRTHWDSVGDVMVQYEPHTVPPTSTHPRLPSPPALQPEADITDLRPPLPSFLLADATISDMGSSTDSDTTQFQRRPLTSHGVTSGDLHRRRNLVKLLHRFGRRLSRGGSSSEMRTLAVV